MKKIIYTCLVLIFSINTLQAQVITTTLGDSTDNCPNIQNAYIYTTTNLSGFNVGDAINQTLYYGDGNSYVFPTFIVSQAFQYINNLTQMHTYAAAGTYNAYMVVTGPGVPTYTSPLYPVIVGVCGTISGKVFNDLNTNCVVDAGEEMNNQQVRLKLNGLIIETDNTDASGNYLIDFEYTAGNTYILEKNNYGAMPCFGVLCPNTITYAITNQNNTNKDFGVGALNANSQHDVWNYTAPLGGMFNAGTNRPFKVYYGNLGCAATNTQLTITLDPSMSFVSGSPNPNNVAGNTITWNINNVVPQVNYVNQYVTFIANLPLLNVNNVPFVIGDSVLISGNMVGLQGTDANPANNAYNKWCYIGTSYDPNDKHVFPKGAGANGNVGFNTEFKYDVNFQNTGVAPAINVVILDTLDADLDENTVEMLVNSHHMLFSKVGNVLKFEFPNIMLPDSNSNPKGSMGGLSFKVKHKTGLPNNTVINNKASIYFDANAPIVTNSTVNTLVTPSAVNDVTKDLDILISPNPTTGILNVNVADKNSTIDKIEIQNILGEAIEQFKVSNNLISLNLSSYNTGIYFLKLTDTKGNFYIRKISKQ